MRLLALTLVVCALWLCGGSVYCQGEMPPYDSQDPCPDSLLQSPSSMIAIVFGVYAETREQLTHAVFLTESLRMFGGRFSETLVRVYVPESLSYGEDSLVTILESWAACVISVRIPPEATRWPFAGKVHAAAQAESETSGKAMLLVWLDDDIVFLREPTALILPPGMAFAYRNAGQESTDTGAVHYDDSFWKRACFALGLPGQGLSSPSLVSDYMSLAPVLEPGVVLVRPERQILRRWPQAFRTLYADSAISELCRQDKAKREMLPEAALVGSILLRGVSSDEWLVLPEVYNGRLLAGVSGETIRTHSSVDEVVILQYGEEIAGSEFDWEGQFNQGSDRMKWLAQRLGTMHKQSANRSDNQ